MHMTATTEAPETEQEISAEPVLRQQKPITLAELGNMVRETHKAADYEDIAVSGVEFDLDANDPQIKFGDVSVPSSKTGLGAWADYFKIPSAYFKRAGEMLGEKAQKEMLEGWQQVAGSSPVRIKYNEAGVLRVGTPSQQTLELLDLIKVVERVLGTDEAQVVRIVDMPTTFAFDVHVPTDYDRAIGGDLRPEQLLEEFDAEHQDDNRKYGDITAGGIGITYNPKLNWAPSIETYLHRLACTNGYRSRDAMLKVDARGQSVEEVLAEVEAAARIAFSRVESEIEHFYRMREERIANPERELLAWGRDFKIPDRVVHQLQTMVPAVLGEHPTRFELVNMATNFANHAQVRDDGTRLKLESVGGSLIHNDAVRCNHCSSMLAEHD